jgi:hypothetical protein
MMVRRHDDRWGARSPGLRSVRPLNSRGSSPSSGVVTGDLREPTAATSGLMGRAHAASALRCWAPPSTFGPPLLIHVLKDEATSARGTSEHRNFIVIDRHVPA